MGKITVEILSPILVLNWFVITNCATITPVPIRQSDSLKSASELLQEMNATDRAALIEFAVRDYLSQNPDMTAAMEQSLKALSTGKKAYQQNTASGTEEIRDVRDLLSIDIFPFIYNKVITPLLRRVLTDVNILPLVSEDTNSTTTAPTTVPPKNYVDIEIKIEETNKPVTTISPNKRTSTTENNARDLLRVEGDAADPITTAASKMKYNIRFRERPSPTMASTRKPYAPDEDDEDESVVFNKIKHL